MMLFGSFAANATDCHFAYPNSQKDGFERFSHKYTSDEFHDYIRYSDETGSRYLNVGVYPEQEYELHVVTVKSGEPIIHVKKSKKPLVLLLAGAVQKWNITVDNDANLKRVYAVGIANTPEVMGLPDKVELSRRIYKCQKLYESVPYKWEGDFNKSALDNEEFHQFKWMVGQTVGQVETSFNGVENASGEIEAPFNPAIYQRNDIAPDVDFFNWSNEQTIKFYQEKLHASEGKSTEIISMIISLMEKGKLPTLFPTEKAASPGSKTASFRYFTPLQFDPKTIVYGAENNVISVNPIDNIIEPGTGNDEINAVKPKFGNDLWMAKDRTIFVFNPRWGNDTLNKGCAGSRNYGLIQTNGKDFWKQKDFKHNIFLVFGAGVYPKDVEWEDPFTLKNFATGDTIKFAETSWCGHIVFYEDGEMKPFSWLDFYDRL